MSGPAKGGKSLIARISAQNSHQAFAAEDAAGAQVDLGAAVSIFIPASSLRSIAHHDSHSDRESQNTWRHDDLRITNRLARIRGQSSQAERFT